MCDFIRYPTIKRLSDESIIPKSLVVLEKIHGANYSFHYDPINQTTRVGRRNSYLTPDDCFYNHQSVFGLHQDDVKIIFEKYQSQHNDENILEFSIFGEIFGGYYPGKVSKYPRICKGVTYCADYNFRCFDIRVRSVCNTGASIKFLLWDDVLKLLLGTSIQPVPEIARGDDIKITPELINISSKLTDLKDNLIEGAVIRALNMRWQVKYKNKIFIEKSKENVRVPNTGMEFMAGDKSVDFSWILEYVNENRLQSAISKIGPLTKTTIAPIRIEMTRDVIRDLAATDYNELSKKHKKYLNKFINKATLELVLKNVQ